jgi:hypothetical protein
LGSYNFYLIINITKISSVPSDIQVVIVISKLTKLKAVGLALKNEILTCPWNNFSHRASFTNSIKLALKQLSRGKWQKSQGFSQIFYLERFTSKWQQTKFRKNETTNSNS